MNYIYSKYKYIKLQKHCLNYANNVYDLLIYLESLKIDDQLLKIIIRYKGKLDGKKWLRIDKQKTSYSQIRTWNVRPSNGMGALNSLIPKIRKYKLDITVYNGVERFIMIVTIQHKSSR